MQMPICALSEDNPFHCTMPKDSVTQARVDGAWHFFDEDHGFSDGRGPC